MVAAYIIHKPCTQQECVNIDINTIMNDKDDDDDNE